MMYLFKKEFDIRHDFEDDDIGLLIHRWPNISFSNIPTAWIVPIDEMLCSLRYNNTITEIRQDYGQLSINYKSLSDGQLAVVKKAEAKIYAIDVDLHSKLDI